MKGLLGGLIILAGDFAGSFTGLLVILLLAGEKRCLLVGVLLGDRRVQVLEGEENRARMGEGKCFLVGVLVGVMSPSGTRASEHVLFEGLREAGDAEGKGMVLGGGERG